MSFAPRVEVGEVAFLEAAFFGERNGEGVAEGKHGGGRGGGRQAHGAGLLGDRAIENDVGGLSERGIKRAGHGQQLHFQTFDVGQQVEDLFSLAALRESEHYVAAHDHPEIAMHGFGRMHKERRGAGGAEGGGDLTRHQTAFPHAGDDDTPTAGVKALDGTVKLAGHGAVQALGQFAQGLGLDPHHVFAGLPHREHEMLAEGCGCAVN
jgi:hypothetical protein